MNKKTLLGLGFVALAAIFALNTRHALNNYGVVENPLHVAVLAQTNTGDDGGGTSNGGGTTNNGGDTSNGGGTTNNGGDTSNGGGTTNNGGDTSNDGGGTTNDEKPENKYSTNGYWKSRDCSALIGKTYVPGKVPICMDGDQYPTCPDCELGAE